MTKPIPAYQKIKDSVLKNIHSGKWQAGDAIPTENVLAETFGVSRMTVNRALKELSAERVLNRRQGSGTFVAQQQYNHTFVEVRNIAADIKKAKKCYQSQVLSKRRILAKEVAPNILKHLVEPMLEGGTKKGLLKNQTIKLSDNDNIDEVKIVHIADGKPIQFEERWVYASVVPDFINQDFSQVNTSDYLIAHAPLEGGNYTIRAVSATQVVADALKLEVGDPVLLLNRQTYSSGQVLTFVSMWHAGSDYQFSGTL